MSIITLNKLSGISLLVSCTCFLLFFGLYAVLLPINADNSNYASLLASHAWIPVNLIQLIAIVTGIFGALGLVPKDTEQTGCLGIVGLVILITGYIMMAGLSFIETFAWATLGRLIEPTQMQTIASDSLRTQPFQTASTLGFHLFSLGYILLGSTLFAAHIYPRWMTACLIAGALLLSTSFLLGALRYKLSPIALLLLGGGLIPMAITWLRHIK